FCGCCELSRKLSARLARLCAARLTHARDGRIDDARAPAESRLRAAGYRDYWPWRRRIRADGVSVASRGFLGETARLRSVARVDRRSFRQTNRAQRERRTRTATRGIAFDTYSARAGSHGARRGWTPQPRYRRGITHQPAHSGSAQGSCDAETSGQQHPRSRPAQLACSPLIEVSDRTTLLHRIASFLIP